MAGDILIMKLTRQAKKLLIENHPDRHGGDTSRLGAYFAALKRPCLSKHLIRHCQYPGCGVAVAGASKHCNICTRVARRLKLAAAAAVMLLCAVVTFPLLASDLKLAWDASPTPGITNYVLYASTNTLTATNLPSAQVRLNVGTNLTATVTDIKAGQWTFAATAMKDGIESAPTLLLAEVPKPPDRMRTVVVQYSGTLTNFYDVGFFRLRLP